MSRRDSDSEKVPAALYDRLTDTPTYAARMYKVQVRVGVVVRAEEPRGANQNVRPAREMRLRGR